MQRCICSLAHCRHTHTQCTHKPWVCTQARMACDGGTTTHTQLTLPPCGAGCLQLQGHDCSCALCVRRPAKNIRDFSSFGCTTYSFWTFQKFISSTSRSGRHRERREMVSCAHRAGFGRGFCVCCTACACVFFMWCGVEQQGLCGRVCVQQQG